MRLNGKRASMALAIACLGSGAGPAAPSPDASVRSRAEALVRRMTTEEKAGQLSQFFYFATPGMPASMTKAADAAIDEGRAGALLFVSDAAQANRLQRRALEKGRLRIPLLFGFDVVHGLRTIFPVPIGMAASWDPAMVEQSQAVAAAEARAVGIHWTFAPMLDIARDPRWGRIVEGAGEDPYLGSVMAAAQVRGFQGARLGSPGHVIAGPKHFAGYGAALGGRDYDEVDLSENQLRNVYLPPFKAAVDAGAGNVMSAYMALNGVPASANRWLLTDVLRKEWGFSGFVVTDAGAARSLVTHGVALDASNAAVRALTAGVDVEMVPPMQEPVMPTLAASLRTGGITAAQLDDAVRRVLEAKIRMGLFEQPYVDEAAAARILEDPSHRAAALVAAERSAVLLRNDGVLPLDRSRIGSVAVIGPLADSARDTLGPWVFPWNGPRAVSVLSGLRAALGPKVRIDYSEGVRMPARLNPSPFAMMDRLSGAPAAAPRPALDETAEIGRAVALARKADVAVLVLGEAQEMIGETASRSSLDLPGRQQELLDAVVAAGRPVVLVLMSGRPLDLKETKASAILDVWYPGSEGGSAVANLLLGAATPGGRLPFSWIRNAAQAPYTYARLPSHDPANADRRYWNETGAPTWPFGHGLSYTSFAYSNLRIDRPTVAPGGVVDVAVDLRNAGGRTGDEVAQLYIHQRIGGASRPVRELKGFQRVTLQPGETRTLHFALRPEDLRYWSAAANGWVQEESSFDVWVGGDSTARLSGSFEVRR